MEILHVSTKTVWKTSKWLIDENFEEDTAQTTCELEER